jgi:DNA-binding Lrp family transcriptional regulator
MTLDLLDRRIVHALQLDGRAPFATVARVLGVSDQTVARRYRRLRGSGAVRVVGLTDARKLGQVDWLVRLRCVPQAAEQLAASLGRRPDTSWVSLTSGGTEIVCFTRAADLLSALPRAPRVVDVTAHCLLRTFYGGVTGWTGKANALTAEEITALTPLLAGGEKPVDRDGPLLAALARDGRASLTTLAATTGWSESTVARRLEDLRGGGALFFDVDVDPALLGYAVEALLWLAVPPSRLAGVGTALAGHPEVAFAAATTGPANLIASVGCRDVEALYDYVATSLGGIDAISAVETAPVVRAVKRAGAVLP